MKAKILFIKMQVMYNDVAQFFLINVGCTVLNHCTLLFSSLCELLFFTLRFENATSVFAKSKTGLLLQIQYSILLLHVATELDLQSVQKTARMSIFRCKLGGLSSCINHTLTEPSGSALRTCSFVSGLFNRVGLGTAVSRNEVQRSNS